MNPLFAFLLLCSVTCTSIGVAKFIAWLLDRRDARVDSAYRAELLVAQARAGRLG